MWITRSELRFGNFSTQYILDVVKGKFQSPVRKNAFFVKYLEQRDSKLVKKTWIFNDFSVPIDLQLVSSSLQNDCFSSKS